MSMTRPLRELPKCELHIHLEGAMRTETLADLCAKHGITRPEDTRHRMYSNFDAFASAYRAACECLRHRDDVFRIVRELLEDALAAGCRWVEVAPSLQLWCDRFDGLEPTVLLLLEAAAAAEDSLGGRVVSRDPTERSSGGPAEVQLRSSRGSSRGPAEVWLRVWPGRSSLASVEAD